MENFHTCILEEHNITRKSSTSASTQVQTHSTTIHSQREFLQKRAAGSKLARMRWHWKGGGQSVIRIIKLKNLELKLWPRIFIIFSLQYCMHVSTVCIICTTFFSPPGWLFNEQPATKQPRLGWGRHFVHRAKGYNFFCFIFSNWIFHLPNGIILSRPAFWTQTLAFRCEVPRAPLPPDTKALILLHTLKMKFNRTRQGL